MARARASRMAGRATAARLISGELSKRGGVLRKGFQDGCKKWCGGLQRQGAGVHCQRLLPPLSLRLPLSFLPPFLARAVSLVTQFETLRGCSGMSLC
jgi:hypothetical protein